jgi:hypothetical protein
MDPLKRVRIECVPFKIWLRAGHRYGLRTFALAKSGGLKTRLCQMPPLRVIVPAVHICGISTPLLQTPTIGDVADIFTNGGIFASPLNSNV